MSYTRTVDSPPFSNAGNKLYAFSGATGIFNTPSSNITFNSNNGRFTVSEQGDYYFDARMIIQGSNNPDQVITEVYLNTGTVYSYRHVAYGIVSPVAIPVSLYLPLNANDYVHLSCFTTGTAGPITMKAGSTMNLYRMTNGPTGPGINAGADTQIIYNSQGSTTGSNNLTFTTNSTLNVPSANITSSANATGSSTGALIVTGGINVNGESTFNNLLYAPSLAGNFINRGNPGQSSALLLSNYNTVHYYSTTSATGFLDISTTMVENAVYEIEFNCYGANVSNNDMFLYPNYTFTGAGAPFYNVYTQSSGSPSITYTTNNQNAFYFDYVGGAIGWDPVGKIKIFNNRSGKKIKVESGDTTAVVNGQGYWTAGAGFTPTSVSTIVYDTTTRWNKIGRLLFSANGNVTFTNWNVWVKRIM
jgi:hypothetical protein